MAPPTAWTLNDLVLAAFASLLHASATLLRIGNIAALSPSKEKYDCSQASKRKTWISNTAALTSGLLQDICQKDLLEASTLLT